MAAALVALALVQVPVGAQFDVYDWELVTSGDVLPGNVVTATLMHIEVPGAPLATNDARFVTTAPESGTFAVQVDFHPSGFCMCSAYSWYEGVSVQLCSGSCSMLTTLDVDAGDLFGFGVQNIDSPGVAWVDCTELVFAVRPELTHVGLGNAWAPGVITINGEHFDATTEVLLDGVPEPVVAWTPTALVIEPQPRDPGFEDLTLINGGLAIALFPDAVGFRPTLVMGEAMIGGPLALRLDAGAPGTWALGLSLAGLAEPIPVGDAYFGLLIDVTTLAFSGAGELAASGELVLELPVPDLPALAGIPLHVQALVQARAADGSWNSFTNLATRVLGYDAASLIAHISGTAARGDFGRVLARAGDLDGDGIDELLVGAPLVGWPDGYAGEVQVWSVTDHALVHRLENPVPASEGRFGSSVAGAGDVDLDGVPDLLVGALDDGLAGLYSGSDARLLRSYPGFGTALAGSGDVDGDGVPDVLVGATTVISGEVKLYSGATGLVLHEDAGGTMDQLGAAVSAAGDVDADGVPDYVVGAPANGCGAFPSFVQVYSGADGHVLLRVEASSFDDLGVAVAAAGDVDGDGRDDVLVGAEQACGFDGTGYALVLSGLDGSELFRFEGLAGETPGVFGEPGDRFGSAVAGLGDVNGDGIPDLLVGAPYEDGLRHHAGVVHVFSGAYGTEILRLPGVSSHAGFGAAVAAMGDVDGDGLMDLAVGIPDAGFLGQSPGGVEIFSIVP